MKRIAAIFILGIPFSIAAWCSAPILLWALIADDESVWRPVGRAMDCLLASLLGFAGTHTFSAELGVGVNYQWLRKILDMIQEGHCLAAAKKEGLL